MSIGKKTGVAGGVFAAAVAIIAIYEGYVSRIADDGFGNPTYCYGETDNPGFAKGRTFTKPECLELLKKSLVKYDDGFMKCVNREIPDSVHIAGISLAYNIGIVGTCRSAFVRKINQGDFKGACDALLGYNHANGRTVPGLTSRRRSERKICLEGL